MTSPPPVTTPCRRCTRQPAAGLPTLADPGYDGVGIGTYIPVRPPKAGQDLDVSTRTRKSS
jgi:hypothetical protein